MTYLLGFLAALALFLAPFTSGTWPLILGGISTVVLLGLLVWWWLGYEARQMAREFDKRFPDGCIICSYHLYGVQEGHTHTLTPPPHECTKGVIIHTHLPQGCGEDGDEA